MYPPTVNAQPSSAGVSPGGVARPWCPGAAAGTYGMSLFSTGPGATGTVETTPALRSRACAGAPKGAARLPGQICPPFHQFAGGRQERSRKDWCAAARHVNVQRPAGKPTPEPREAPLYPYHPSDPFCPDSRDPVYWVTLRHLAGDDGVLAERIGDALAGLGWRMWPTSRNTLLYVSPDELCGAEWILAAYPFELGGLPVAWQLSARSYAASAMTEWNAYFTAGIPYEALADLLVAIDAREAPDVGFEGPETVLDALSARGWIRDVDRPRTTATDPGFSSSVSLEMLPPLVQDADPRPDLVGWQAWAEPVLGAPYLWCASFSASVPHDLVAAFASSLASPVPVPRRALRKSAEGRLSVVRRS